MPTPSEANTSTIRGYNTAQMQQMNYVSSISLQQPARLGRDYSKFNGGDGEAIATEITNRLSDYTNAENKKMYCDARMWMNQEQREKGRVGREAPRIDGQILSDDKYKLVVEYNMTDGNKHFWNLMMIARVPGYDPPRFQKAQVAHISMYSQVEAPTAKRTEYTILGAFHLKDDLALGVLDRSQKNIDKTKPHQHAAGLIPHQDAIPAAGRRPAEPFKAAQITSSFRRYFIKAVSFPGVPAKVANATTGTPAIPAKAPRVEYQIGLQNQVGNVSKMAVRFGHVAFTVIQKYIDDGFSRAGFTTPVNPTNFVAKNHCKPDRAAAYIERDDIGKTEDQAPPSGLAERAAARRAAEARGLDPTKPANLLIIAGEEDTAEAAGRLAALRRLPLVGGKRKTRRTKRHRRSTQKRR